MIDRFNRLQEFINEMNSSTSTTNKINVLSKYSTDSDIRNILYYTYNPYFNFGVTSSNLKKKKDLIHETSEYASLFTLLDDLNSRSITGHTAIGHVNRFIQNNLPHANLIFQILDRNLETRATAALINRVMPGLIPEFNVALAYDYTKVKGINLIDGTWYVSRKLDGVRCLAIIKNNKVEFFSRNGKSFNTLDLIKKELESLAIGDCVLDGEICIMEEDGSDNFQGILKEIQRKNHTIKSPRFWIFDILTIEEFESGAGNTRLVERCSRITFNSDLIQNLPHYLITSEAALSQLKERAKLSKWEGLMARKNVEYEGERTKNLLKLKEFHDAEYTVTEVIMEKQRVIIDHVEYDEEMLSAVIIEHMGNRVRVGSGFSIEERRDYFKNPNKILGSIITVQYFESTIDQFGQHSLRFPVFKVNHGKSRSI